MLQSACSADATEGAHRHGVTPLAGDDDALGTVRVRPHLMRPALPDHYPTRISLSISLRSIRITRCTCLRTTQRSPVLAGAILIAEGGAGATSCRSGWLHRRASPAAVSKLARSAAPRSPVLETCVRVPTVLRGIRTHALPHRVLAWSNVDVGALPVLRSRYLACRTDASRRRPIVLHGGGRRNFSRLAARSNHELRSGQAPSLQRRSG